MKALALVLSLSLILSCRNGNFSFYGKVKSIEMGKDGYTAVIKNEKGDSVSATISRNDMGVRFKKIRIGENVKIFGDSSHFGKEISIHVIKIKN